MINKFFTALVIASMGFFMTGCGSDAEPNPRETVYIEKDAEEPNDLGGNSEAMEDRFVEFIRDEIPGAEVETDADIIDLGKSVCEAFDNGASFEKVGTTFLDGGFSVNEAGTFIGASVGAFCEEHVDILEDAANSSTTV